MLTGREIIGNAAAAAAAAVTFFRSKRFHHKRSEVTVLTLMFACLLVHKPLPLPLHGMAWHCLTCKGGFHRVVVGTRQIRQGQLLSPSFERTNKTS